MLYCLIPKIAFLEVPIIHKSNQEQMGHKGRGINRNIPELEHLHRPRTEADNTGKKRQQWTSGEGTEMVSDDADE